MSWLLVIACIVASGWAAAIREDLIHERRTQRQDRRSNPARRDS
ncbi:hypothetical protein BX265_5006 [Streptomyces sp. TLI_235]|nr:hypothetical protein [Streptomyces sp. TLI_235]PBC72218.1 hypothetical protein BX265_6840 [Streptomyces sp. TLI_235]PBC80169.1 hypothetical protein BX265_5006 [Streptomyces sp. TLI_235]